MKLKSKFDRVRPGLRQVALLAMTLLCLTNCGFAAKPAQDDEATGARALRAFWDPAFADSSCWMLRLDPVHPEGPGKWARTRSTIKECLILDRGKPSVLRSPTAFVIRAGDTLTIAEQTSAVEVLLQGIAVESAVPGDVFRARLQMNGKLVQAVAVNPGHARLASRNEARP